MGGLEVIEVSLPSYCYACGFEDTSGLQIDADLSSNVLDPDVFVRGASWTSCMRCLRQAFW